MQKPKEPSCWLFKAVWKGVEGGGRLEEWRSVLDNMEVWMGRVSELGFLMVKVGGQKKKGGEGNFILRQLGNMSCAAAAAAARQPAALGLRWQKHLAARQHDDK